MAKKKIGLPDEYDLKVTRSDLLDGPATLPGYLDDATRFTLPPIARKVETVEAPKPQIRVVPPRENYEESFPVTFENSKVVEKKITKPQKKPLRRVQINVTPEIERKVDELLRILGNQSPDGSVTASEMFQALVLNLYDVRDNISGRLPQRGKWGTTSAKSYPAELAIVLRQAMLKEGKEDGFSTFKRSVG